MIYIKPQINNKHSKMVKATLIPGAGSPFERGTQVEFTDHADLGVDGSIITQELRAALGDQRVPLIMVLRQLNNQGPRSEGTRGRRGPQGKRKNGEW